MLFLTVQRSGRTSIFATTRSLSASTNVTPFNSANGIFIARIFSSGVMIPPARCFLTTRLSIQPARDNRSFVLHITAMRKFPPSRIVCLTEETVETLYLLGEQHRIVGVSGYAVRPPQVRREKPRVSAFTTANLPKILALNPDLVLTFSDLQAPIVAELVRAGIAVHVFNQRDIA